MSDFRFFLQYIAHHKLSYLLGIVALGVTNWLAVTIPVYIGSSVDLLNDLLNKGAGDDYSQLLTNIYFVIGFAVLMIVARTLSRMWFFNPGRDVERELKNDSFEKLTLLQRWFYNETPVGSLISIVNNDVNGVRAMAGVGMMQAFNILFALSFTPVKMWQLSPSLTLYCMVPILFGFGVVTMAIRYVRRLMRERMHALQELSSSTVSYLNGVEVIKSHHIQPWATAGFDAENQRLLDLSLKQLAINTFFMPILQYVDVGLKILILAVGGSYLVQSNLTLGELTALLAYVSLLALPFISLGRIIAAFQMGMVSLRSIRRILDAEVDEGALYEEVVTSYQETAVSTSSIDKGGLSSDGLFNKGLRVENLSYRYPFEPNHKDKQSDKKPADKSAEKPETKNPLVLNNISFEIKKGEKVALLGKVGCGKTTLVNCLNRYLDVEPGQIFIDDLDATELSRQSLRHVVRTITQEPYLFSDTVSNNITFGAGSNEDRLSIEEALYQSDMLDEVGKFPLAEETMVGEKGILLSGGQKQRLSLARGMYTPCKLIVLDNVLSAVDNDTERFLLGQIFDTMRSDSSLIVSHRPAVLERVDKILLMDSGTIVASGSHDELLATSARYRDTWTLLEQGQDLGAETETEREAEEAMTRAESAEGEGAQL